MIKLGLGIDEADEEVSVIKPVKRCFTSFQMAFGFHKSCYLKTEDAADDGEMPPLEGAEEDASRMEEVNIVVTKRTHKIFSNCPYSPGGLSFSKMISAKLYPASNYTLESNWVKRFQCQQLFIAINDLKTICETSCTHASI